MFRAPRLFIVLALALGLVAAACGDVSDSLETEATTSTVAESTPTTAVSEGGGDGRVISEGDTVSVHYVGTLDSGEQFDSSRDRGQPLTFAVGSGQMILGFDTAVRGMTIGEIKTVRLEPSEAYGEVDAGLLIEESLDRVPEGTVVGDQLIDAQGQAVTVVEVRDGIVVIDLNHRLAGEFLTFEIEIVSIDS